MFKFLIGLLINLLTLLIFIVRFQFALDFRKLSLSDWFEPYMRQAICQMISSLFLLIDTPLFSVLLFASKCKIKLGVWFIKKILFFCIYLNIGHHTIIQLVEGSLNWLPCWSMIVHTFFIHFYMSFYMSLKWAHLLFVSIY